MKQLNKVLVESYRANFVPTSRFRFDEARMRRVAQATTVSNVEMNPTLRAARCLQMAAQVNGIPINNAEEVYFNMLIDSMHGLAALGADVEGVVNLAAVAQKHEAETAEPPSFAAFAVVLGAKSQ